MTEADHCARVYAPNGKLAHLLDIGVSPDLAWPARCGRQVTSWLGTGSQPEYETAASLPLCFRCGHLSPELPAAAAITATGTGIPVPLVSPAGGTGAVPAAPSQATPEGAAAKPAEPGSPSGDAGGAQGRAVPRGPGPGAPAGLSSPTPGPEDSPAPGPSPGALTMPAPGGGAAGRTWTVELPAGLPLLSLNGRDHWRARNQKAQALKDAAIVMTRKARVPRLECITVALYYDPPDRRKRDHDNLMATYKHLVDGIVKAGVVPDDSPEYVFPPHCEVTESVHPHGRLRMVIVDLGGEAA